MTDEINAQFGFERAFGKTNDNADADTKITRMEKIAVINNPFSIKNSLMFLVSIKPL